MAAMDIGTIIFFAITLLLAVVGIFVISLFLRYRFKGDKSLAIVSLFVILFVAAAGFTLLV